MLHASPELAQGSLIDEVRRHWFQRPETWWKILEPVEKGDCIDTLEGE